MTHFLGKLSGYQRWGQVLAVIAKLRWFESNNYLVGFCKNYGYDYSEVRAFLKIANSIIEGDTQLVNDLRVEYEQIRGIINWSEEEMQILNSFVTSC
jgi:hypothetical protein